MKRAVLAGLALLLTALTAPSVLASEALAERHACLNCHEVNKKMVGPAFKAVAERYRGQADAGERLTAQVAKGGSGVWGAVPMPGMPHVPPAEARNIIDWILALQ